MALSFLIVALVAPVQAGAQTPTDSQYAPPSQITVGGGGGGEPSAFGPLPFTGLDLISLLAIAVALTGAGLALRRLSATEGR